MFKTPLLKVKMKHFQHNECNKKNRNSVYIVKPSKKWLWIEKERQLNWQSSDDFLFFFIPIVHTITYNVCFVSVFFIFQQLAVLQL